jgi:tetratricopeptide (TPR) repeat protein
MALSWPSFHRLSPVTVFYLEAVRRNRPGWFKDVPALLRTTPNPQTQVYGQTMAPDAVVLPRLYWHIGEARLLEKDYAGAADDFTRALRLDPSLSWARLSLAVAEALRGDGKRGLALLKQAAEGAAGDPARDEILAASVAAGKALGLEGAEEVAGSDPDFWLDKAEKAAAAGRKEDGRGALGRALALSPQPHQLRRAAQYYRMLGDLDRVFDLSGALVKSYPGEADMWLMRAEGAFATAHVDAGQDALRRAEKLNPDPFQRKQIEGWRARFAAAP